MDRGPLGLAQVRSAGGTHSSAAVVAQVVGAFTKRAGSFELSQHDSPVLHGYGEFVALMDVEEPTGLSWYDDPSQVVDFSYDERVHGVLLSTPLADSMD